MLTSDVVHMLQETCYKFCKHYGFDYDYILECAREQSFRDYYQTLESSGLKAVCLAVGSSYVKIDKSDLMGIDVYDRFEELWAFLNRTSFLLNCSSIKEKNYKPKADDVVKIFEKLEKTGITDLTFDFTDRCLGRVAAKLSKSSYVLADSSEQVWNYTMYINDDIKDASLTKFECLAVNVVPSKFPRVFMWSFLCRDCCECTRKTFHLSPTDEFCSSLGRIENEMSILSKVAQKTKCQDLNCFRLGNELDFTDVLNAVLYALDKFVNRKKIHKEESQRESAATNSSASKSVKIQIPEQGENSHFVTLSDFVVYEKHHKGSKHGTHASPCEHARSGYWRVYKSGKRVWVKPTVVNKGKTKSVYRVS